MQDLRDNAEKHRHDSDTKNVEACHPELVPRAGAIASPAQAVFGTTPASVVTYAVEVANALAPVIEKQGFFSIISGRKYVRVEAWCILGTMLGFLPREASVKELPDGSYEASVELISIKSGHVVSQASAICGVDEKRWANAERYARRSMAITRATGKAYRLAFSWVVALAGYETTPAEEMPSDEPPQARRGEQVSKYRHNDKDCQDWLKVKLEKADIPPASWKDFSMRYHGQYMTDLALEVAIAKFKNAEE